MNLPKSISGSSRQAALNPTCLPAGNTLVFRQQQQVDGLPAGNDNQQVPRETLTIVLEPIA